MANDVRRYDVAHRCPVTGERVWVRGLHAEYGLDIWRKARGYGVVLTIFDCTFGVTAFSQSWRGHNLLGIDPAITDIENREPVAAE